MIYDINDLNTSGFQYDPKDPAELERLRVDIPEFAERPRMFDKSGKLTEKKAPIDLDSINRYVLLMYDKASQLRREYPKIRQRKTAAAQYAGFSIIRTRRAFRKEVEQMFIGKLPEVNQMIVKYILSYNDPDQLALEMYYEMYQRQSAAMLQSIADPKEYKVIFEISEKFRKAISELTNKTLGGQDEAEIIKELYADLGRLRDTMMPEYIADSISKNEELIYNPYGTYKPEPLTLTEQEHIYKADDED